MNDNELNLMRKRKSLRIEILIFSVVFVCPLFLPFSTVFDFEKGKILEVEYGFENQIELYYIVVSYIGLFCMLFLNKILINIINPIVLAISVVIPFLFVVSASMSGVKTSFNVGFFVAFGSILLFAIRSYIWSQYFNAIKVKKYAPKIQ